MTPTNTPHHPRPPATAPQHDEGRRIHSRCGSNIRKATITAETSVASYTREQRAVQSAAELIAFADGIEDAGHPALARRARNVARETIWLAERVAAEMSARIAMQEARDRAMAMLMERGK